MLVLLMLHFFKHLTFKTALSQFSNSLFQFFNPIVKDEFVDL